jgi:hypothetical protein
MHGVVLPCRHETRLISEMSAVSQIIVIQNLAVSEIGDEHLSSGIGTVKVLVTKVCKLVLVPNTDGSCSLL